jgi:polyphosphate kinase
MTERPISGEHPMHDLIRAERLDSFDEELELEIDDDRLTTIASTS